MRDDWISVSEIGEQFNGVTLTRESYLHTENAYCSTIKNILSKYSENKLVQAGEPFFYDIDPDVCEEDEDVFLVEEVFNLEKHIEECKPYLFGLTTSDVNRFPINKVIESEELDTWIRLSLREIIGGKLEDVESGVSIQIVDDFYVFIGLPCLNQNELDQLLEPNLFIRNISDRLEYDDVLNFWST